MGLTYDATRSLTADATTGNQYLYDAEGQVCATMNLFVGTMTGYIYEGVPVDRSSSTGRDAEGTRVAKGTISAWTCDIKSNGFQPVSDYIIGPGGEQLTETGSDGQGNMVCSHTNVFAAGSLIGTYDKDGLHFYLSDWLGNRRVQTDYAGVFEQSCTNLPFGDSLNCTASLVSPTEHHFTGKERDVETGNDYFGARYYASTMGRFLMPDWSVKVEPVPYAKMDDPQSLNLYAYVQNSPLARTDPDGHAFGLDDLVGSFVGAVAGVAVELGKDAITGEKPTAGGVLAAAAGGALLGEGVVNAPETGGLSVIAAGAAKGAIEGAVLNAVQQGTDIATGSQKKFSGASMLVSTGAGLVSGGVITRVGAVRVPGVTSGRGNMAAVAQAVRTRISSGVAAKMSWKTALKGAIAGQAGNAGKTLTEASTDAVSKKVCGEGCK